MAKQNTRKARKELLGKRDELRRKLQALDLLQRGPSGGTLAEPGDQATQNLEGESIVLVAERHADELQRIEQALDRLKRGRYGICDSCGRPIGQPRLKAMPSTTLCVECKRMEEALEGPTGERTYVQRWGVAEELLLELEDGDSPQ